MAVVRSKMYVPATGKKFFCKCCFLSWVLCLLLFAELWISYRPKEREFEFWNISWTKTIFFGQKTIGLFSTLLDKIKASHFSFDKRFPNPGNRNNFTPWFRNRFRRNDTFGKNELHNVSQTFDWNHAEKVFTFNTDNPNQMLTKLLIENTIYKDSLYIVIENIM